MKTYSFKRTTLACLTACALGIGGAAALHAQGPQLQIAPAQPETGSIANLLGQPLRGAQQEDFGTVADFLVNPQTGRIHFVMATTGAGPSGQTYRVVPMDAFSSTAPNQLTLGLGQAQWEQVGTLTESQLQGNISLDQEHLQRLSRQFSLGQQPDSESAASLVRVTQVKGKEVRSGNESLGRIEDIVVDVHHRAAVPVMAATGSLAASGQKYIVPFTELQFTEGQGTITTALTRADFQNLQPTPTGYPSSQFGQQPANSAVTAVQQALAQNPSLAASGVQVVPETRIVLRGTVENNAKKAEIEQAARQAAAGVQVDSELTVRGWW
jgi:hypothetical protein